MANDYFRPKWQPQTSAFLQSVAPSIRDYSSALGVGHLGLMASLAEENWDYFDSPALNWAADYFHTGITHDTIRDQYNFVHLPENSRLLNSPSTPDKIKYAVTLDYGPANIKLSSAIDALNYYTSRFGTTDPLGILKYNQDYASLRSDLIHDNTITVKIATVITHQAEGFFKAQSPARWAAATDTEKAGLVATYYNRGETALLADKGEPGWPVIEKGGEFFEFYEKEISDAYKKGLAGHCFVGGTLVSVPGGVVAIENIKIGDEVLGFDNKSVLSRLEAAVVLSVFKKEVDRLISFHDIISTEGHLFLNGSGKFKRLQEIILEDDTVVWYNGSIIRARTGVLFNDIEDRIVQITFCSGQKPVLIRAGVPYGRLDPDGPIYTLSAKMKRDGYRLRDDGLFENADGEVKMAEWPWGDPREHPVARDYVVGEPWEIAAAPVKALN